jgi:hypothetical protein
MLLGAALEVGIIWKCIQKLDAEAAQFAGGAKKTVGGSATACPTTPVAHLA